MRRSGEPLSPSGPDAAGSAAGVPVKQTLSDLEAYLGALVVTQGRLTGRPLHLMPWQRDFLAGAFDPSTGTAALTLARGQGKSTLVSAIACAALDGPLAQPRGEVVVVASSFAQGRSAVFEAARAFLLPKIEADKRSWRLQDSVNTASIEYRPTGSRLRVLGSDPRRAHGLAPSLILADEPSQWPPGTAEAMYAALLTARGKLPGSRLVALGTRPSEAHHWFSEMLTGGADFALSFTAPPDADPFDPEAWAVANPSLSAFPDLAAVIRSEAEKARDNPSLLPAFKALRLNMGTADTLEAVLIEADAWRRVEVEALPPAEGLSVWGVDLGMSAAMSAVACYHPLTGRLECMAAFPSVPELLTRGKADGVGDLYAQMAARGELVTVGGHTVDVSELLGEAVERFGPPSAIAADRWRQGELLDALERSSTPPCEVIWRGQGFRDGSADILSFERVVLEGRVSVAPSLLLRAALAEARVQSDPAGNRKVSKGSAGGRRSRGRDDAAVAVVLALALGSRLGAEVEAVEAPRYAIV